MAATIRGLVFLSLGVATAAPDGSWTAVLGYDNRTGASIDIPAGPANQVTPTSSGQLQLTAFAASIRHGVFSVTVTGGGGPMWHLGDINLAARKTDTACPSPTQMPGEGNGVGAAIVIAAAASVGVMVVRGPLRCSDMSAARS